MPPDIKAQVSKGDVRVEEDSSVNQSQFKYLTSAICSPHLFNSVNTFQLIFQSLGRGSHKTKSLRLKFRYLHCNLASTPIL